MKKLFTLLLAVLFTFTASISLVACNKDNDDTPPTPDVPTSMTYTSYKTQDGALAELASGSADIAVVEKTSFDYYVKISDSSDLMILDGADFTFESENYVMACKKDSNVDNYINAGLYKFQQENVTVNYTNNGGNVSCNLAYVADDFGLKSNLITIAEPSVKTDTAPALGSEFERILNDGFKIGIVTSGFTREINNQPFAGNSHLAGDNGFEILICRALGAIYNKKVDTTSTQIIDLASGKAALDNGTLDLLIGGRSAKNWGDDLDFSVPYISNRQVIVIRTADKDKYSSYEKMKSAKFTAAENSEGETLLKGEINKKVFGN